MTATSALAQGSSVDYEIVATHSGKCLEVAGGSLDDGAPITQWTCHGGPNQRWIVSATDDGFYRIAARHSGKVINVSRAEWNDLAPIIQWAPTGAANEQFRLEPGSGGAYVIVARHSGKALDVYGASDADGTPIIQYQAVGGAGQEWRVRPVDTTTPPPPPPPPPTSVADVVRFLEQATWGPTPALVDQVSAIGVERYLDAQLAAPPSSYPTMPLYPTTRDQVACPSNSECARDNYTLYRPQNQFFLNALYGNDQLRQRMAFALHQIIVVSGVDVTQPSWMTAYLQTLDRHALGSFRDLLRDISLSPAMGNYLDIANNAAANPNENYAREILQLFSIGTVQLHLDGTPRLDGNGQPLPTYDQATVNQFARVFTGWRLAAAPATGVPNYLDPMVANEGVHDRQPKTLLRGETLGAGQSARQDLEAAIDNIFNDPNVAPFISKQLIQHLVTSNPSPAYVARVAAVFASNATGVRGDLGAVAKAILLDEEARGDRKSDPTYGRLRHPVQFAVNLLRAFNARSADLTGPSDGYVAPQVTPLGMDLFRPPSVFSYYSPGGGVPGVAGLRGPEFGALTTSTALRRANFVNTMVFSRIAVSANAPSGTALDLAALQALAANPAQLLDYLDRLLLHETMSAEMRRSILTAVSAVPTNNPLKRARTALYLVTTSSQFQVQR